MKFKYISDFFYPPDAVEACNKASAELWDVLDGDVEWNAVVNSYRQRERFSQNIWINGKIETGCPGIDHLILRALSWENHYIPDY